VSVNSIRSSRPLANALLDVAVQHGNASTDGDSFALVIHLLRRRQLERPDIRSKPASIVEKRLARGGGVDERS
jgi:hypothetical protein